MLNVQFSPVLITISSEYVKVISELEDTQPLDQVRYPDM